MQSTLVTLMLACLLFGDEPSKSKSIEIPVFGFSLVVRNPEMTKEIAKANARMNGSRVIEGFDFTYTKKDDWKIIYAQTKALLKEGKTKPIFREVNLGKRSYMMCKLFILLEGKRVKALESAKKGSKVHTIELFLSDINMPSLIMNEAISKALDQHFNKSGKNGIHTGHGWLEDIEITECEPDPGEGNRIKVKLTLRLKEKRNIDNDRS